MSEDYQSGILSDRSVLPEEEFQESILIFRSDRDKTLSQHKRKSFCFYLTLQRRNLPLRNGAF